EDLNIMPATDAIVIDEAHELTDRITSAVTAHLSGPIIRNIAKQARQEASVVSSDLTDAAAALEAAFSPVPTGWFAQGLGDHQLDALEPVRDQTRQLITDVKESGTTDKEAPDRQLIRQRSEEHTSDL